MKYIVVTNFGYVGDIPSKYGFECITKEFIHGKYEYISTASETWMNLSENNTDEYDATYWLSASDLKTLNLTPESLQVIPVDKNVKDNLRKEAILLCEQNIQKCFNYKLNKN